MDALTLAVLVEHEPRKPIMVMYVGGNTRWFHARCLGTDFTVGVHRCIEADNLHLPPYWDCCARCAGGFEEE